MQREIKFRVFIPTTKGIGGKFEYPTNISLWNNEDLQQYTGLKDKNNKEIYEGDIVKERHYDDWTDKDGYVYLGVVRHKTHLQDDAGNQFSGFVTYPNLGENAGWVGNPIKAVCEVIGNMFENAKLLDV